MPGNVSHQFLYQNSVQNIYWFFRVSPVFSIIFSNIEHILCLAYILYVSNRPNRENFKNKSTMKKNQKGFSLIELLIVVVIIGIIAAIAIPNLLASRRAANEASAISAMRTVHSANITYQSTSGAGKFAATLLILGNTTLIDSYFANATSASASKNGYFFTYTADVTNDPSTYTFKSQPSSTAPISGTGTHEFFVNESGVIRSAMTGVSVNSSPINN